MNTVILALIGWTLLLGAPIGMVWLYMQHRYPGATERRARTRNEEEK